MSQPRPRCEGCGNYVLGDSTLCLTCRKGLQRHSPLCTPEEPCLACLVGAAPSH